MPERCLCRRAWHFSSHGGKGSLHRGCWWQIPLSQKYGLRPTLCPHTEDISTAAGHLPSIDGRSRHGRGKAPLSNKSAFFFCIWSWPAPKEAGAEYAHHGQTRTRLLRKGCRRPSADRSLPLSPLSSGRLFPPGKPSAPAGLCPPPALCFFQSKIFSGGYRHASSPACCRRPFLY